MQTYHLNADTAQLSANLLDYLSENLATNTEIFSPVY